MYGLTSPVNGIPMTDEAVKELVERKYMSNKIQRAEFRNSNPTLKPFSNVDRHHQTREDNNLTKDWVEKINGSYGEPLTCGDRVYYFDHQARGSNRWRRGIILQRKADYIYSSGIYRSHGYDIYDIKNCTTVSRTRQDIRKYKHTKIEREILERANKHLAEMRREFLKNIDFQNPNIEKPVEFEIKDYDTAVKNSKYPQQAPENRPTVMEESTQEKPQRQESNPEPTEETITPENPENPSPNTTETATPSDPKASLVQRRLGTGLDGNYWQSTESHGRRLRVRTTKLQEEEENLDSWDNTIPAEGDEAGKGE